MPAGTFRKTGPLEVWGKYSVLAKGGPGRGGPRVGDREQADLLLRGGGWIREPEICVQLDNSRDAGWEIRARCFISERELCANDSASSVGVLEGSVSEVAESILAADGEM